MKPTIAQDFMERIQIDLIDMRHSPDGDFNYIGHFEDHMTKFHILFPLRDKSAYEVATMIEFLLMLDHPTSFILIMVESL